MASSLLVRVQRVARFLDDPLGFSTPLDGVTLHPTDLPSWTREHRLSGEGR